MSDSDDEPITLSADTLAALSVFQAEQREHEKKYQQLNAGAKDERSAPLSMDAFKEDWNESQFWYAEETANTYARELLDGATSDTTIAVLSAPSAYIALKNALRDRDQAKAPKLVLLEHDRRFSIFPDFVFYDFQQPLKLPSELKASVDRVISDPPFLSEDCQTKFALTARWLLKPRQVDANSSQRVIICTGERMEGLVTKLYQHYNVQTTTYEPRHAKGLGNEWYCYASFECPDWKWKTED